MMTKNQRQKIQDAADDRLDELSYAADRRPLSPWNRAIRHSLAAETGHVHRDERATACLLILSLLGDIEGGPDASLQALQAVAAELIPPDRMPTA